MVVFMVDGTHWTKDDEMVLGKLRHLKCPVVLAVNKIDNVKEKEDLLPHRVAGSADELRPHPAHQCREGHQRGEDPRVGQDLLPENVHFFPEDYVTDRSSRFMASEIIREKLMRFTGEELPYSVTVEIERFKVEENGLYHIHGLILVERDGQKKMVIGNKGEKIKTIGTEARLDMERLFQNKVHLELWVKVKSGWADDERALRSLGYGDD